MDFSLPEELRLLKAELRKFVDKEMIPRERDTRNGEAITPEIEAVLSAGTRDLGLWLMEVPEAFGGTGMGLLATVVVWEELTRSVVYSPRRTRILGPDPSPILYHLDAAQRERYLDPVIAGEKTCCFAQTEPDAGSDPAAMRTRAVRDGDHYVINGVKRFITFAEGADFAQVMAVTGEGGGAGAISCFLVDMDTPGVRISAKYQTLMGDEPCEIVFEDARVPVANLVGAEGEGFKLAQGWIEVGRIKHGARALGAAERCLELASSYAKQRVTFGELLADRQGIQWMLADSYVSLHAARLMVYQAAWKYDRGEDTRNEAFIVKLFCDEMAFDIADRCMQIHGGIGLTTDLPIEKIWREQRALRITEGASEVMRMVIARHVLKIYD